MTKEVIYLIPGEGEYHETHVWCDDPAPGVDHDQNDAIKYIRYDVVEKKMDAVVEAIKETFGNQPVANDGTLLVSVYNYNKLAEKISAL